MRTGSAKDPAKKRRGILIAVLVAAVLFVLAALFWFVIRPALIRRLDSPPTSMYSDTVISYDFYPSDYELDVTAVPEYMQEDRSVHYRNGAVTILVKEEALGGYNDAVRFFVSYFDTVIRGDWETYNTYFTDRYYETEEPHVPFAPQMIYNIEVEQLDESVLDDGTTAWTFDVGYMIYRNDGTFRNDIPSNAVKKLRFSLIGTSPGEVKIDAIDYYRSR